MPIRGIILCIVGSIALMCGGLLWLYQSTGQNAKVVKRLPVNLSQSSVSESTEAFSIAGDVYLTLWLKVPGRAIETKEISFTANFINATGANVSQIVKEFGFFHTRTSVADGQLYKIGAHRFSNGFIGSLHFIRISEWNPNYDAMLLVKMTDPKSEINPLYYAGIITLGALLITFGILLMNRASPYQRSHT